MLIVGPLAPVVAPEPGSAADIAEKLQMGLRAIEASLNASVATAIRLEAQRCCEDVCVHCKPAARQWMTIACYNEEMRAFYHYDIHDTKRIVAACSASNIWTRMRQQEILEKWKRERQFAQPWDGVGGGLVYGQPQPGAVAGIPPIYAAGQQMPVDGSVKIFKLENDHMSETVGYGEYCETCSGTGWSKTMKDVQCNMCNGTGKRPYEEVQF
jgi:hypothetical protein